MSYVTILVTDVNGVRMITLNRPERRNAMTPEMQHELIQAMEEAAASDDCSVVVFTGAGDAFCAGLDLSALQGMNEKSAAEHTADAERIARLFRTLYELPKPTIAAVHGAAIAGGTGLATMCDFTLAVPGAKFGYTEVKIGFVPAVVSAFLVLQIGEKAARDLLLTGRIFTSDEAARLGLVNEVVDAEKLTARTLELVGVLRANSPEAMAATKRLLAAQNKAWLDMALAEALAANAEARATHDFREGVAAFLEKRKPVWGGGL
ncbi:enoyl-CoA hydratase/isomerase family protein [Tunturiibacter gelidiferens]|uniref:enoyl-CoA hydratase/isomerase family protein n=1 Tax=Tunturiibacter gelidiferens TaxID=3069689 RepID=UPI003D9B24EB